MRDPTPSIHRIVGETHSVPSLRASSTSLKQEFLDATEMIASSEFLAHRDCCSDKLDRLEYVCQEG